MENSVEFHLQGLRNLHLSNQGTRLRFKLYYKYIYIYVYQNIYIYNTFMIIIIYIGISFDNLMSVYEQ